MSETATTQCLRCGQPRGLHDTNYDPPRCASTREMWLADSRFEAAEPPVPDRSETDKIVDAVIGRILDADRIENPSGFIQWKGTDACIDFHCECGAHGHFDGMFGYYVHCATCGRTYAVGASVRLYPLTAEEAAAINDDRPNLVINIPDA